MKKLAISVLLASSATLGAFGLPSQAMAQQSPVTVSNDLEQQVIEWRRHIHANPELSNREFETAKMVEKHLR